MTTLDEARSSFSQESILEVDDIEPLTVEAISNVNKKVYST